MTPEPMTPEPTVPITLPPVEKITLGPPGVVLPSHAQAPPSVKKALKTATPKKAGSGMFRCYNCVDPANGKPGVMFESAVPKCPDCGVDGTIERFHSLIVPVAVIHYDPPHPTIKGVAARYHACTPSNEIGKCDGMATGEILAVTCTACLDTPAALAALGVRSDPAVPAEADFKVGEPTKGGK